MLEGQVVGLPARKSILYRPPREWKANKVLLEWPLAAVGKGGRQPDVIFVDDKGRMLAVEIANTNSKQDKQEYLHDLKRWGLLAIEVDVRKSLQKNPPLLSTPFPGAQLIREAGSWLYQGEPGKLFWLPFEGNIPLDWVLSGTSKSKNVEVVNFLLCVEHSDPIGTEWPIEYTGFRLQADAKYLGQLMRSWRWRFVGLPPSLAELAGGTWESKEYTIGQACKFIKENIQLGEGLLRLEPPKLPTRWTTERDSEWLPGQECQLKWADTK